MFKRLFLILIVLCSVALIVFTLWKTDKQETQHETLLHHVAGDAVLVLEIEDAQQFHRKLKEGSVLWPDLTAIPWAADMDRITRDIDSLLAPNYKLNPDSSCSYVLSLHPSGQDFAWTLTVGLDENQNLQDLMRLAQGYIPADTRSYNGHEIYTLSGGGADLYAARNSSVLYLSSSDLTLEQILRSGDAKLMDSEAFAKSYATKGKHSLGHVYVNWQRFPQVLSELMPNSPDKHSQAGFAGWAASDLLSDANSLYLHGLVQTSDSLGHTLEHYRSQGAGDYTDLLDYCPINTAWLSYHHISDRRGWTGNKAVIDSLDSYFGEGILQAELESSGESRGYVILPLESSKAVKTWLQTDSAATEDILGFEVYSDWSTAMLSTLYSDQFFKAQMSAVLLDEYLILCHDESSMKDLLLAYQSSRVLSEDEHFMQLNDDLDDQTSLFHYFNIARCQALIQSSLAPEIQALLTDNLEGLQQFQALVLQYEPAAEGLYHQNLLLRHNPIYKKETSSLWEHELASSSQGDIHLLKNHYSNQYELLIQDEAQALHLIDNTGKELWQFEPEGVLRSAAQQVDLYKNGKLQIAFNTDTHFYILDRNGKLLEGYPVMLSDTASSTLSIMDYDDTRSYRFLIATADGMVHNYDREGKEVDGWKYKPGESAVVGNLQHFVIGKKDYISAISADGSVQFLARNGKSRHETQDMPLSDYNQGAYRLIRGKKIGDSRIIYTDRDGSLLNTTLDGDFKVLAEDAVSSLELQPAYILHGGEQSTWYNLRSEAQFDVSHGLQIRSSDAQALDHNYLGLHDKDNGLYYLYGPEGKLVDGFPLPGKQALVHDINQDGTLDVILWEGKAIAMYSLSGN